MSIRYKTLIHQSELNQKNVPFVLLYFKNIKWNGMNTICN